MSDEGSGQPSGHAGGEHRVRFAELFDAEVRPHNERFRAATAVGAADRVLDVGCGTGESTREAARAALAGHVLGVDLSAPMLDRARRLTDDEGLRNVSYLRADAQVHRFPERGFDVCISRFGAMFFADPVVAFTTIGCALRPGGRLVLLVWQDDERNEWSHAVRESIAAGSPAPDPQPFSLGDPTVADTVLTAAGFTDVDFADVHEPVYYGPDTATAAEFVLGPRATRSLLAALDPPAAALARERLRATLAAHHSGAGVYFDSRAWIITAAR